MRKNLNSINEEDTYNGEEGVDYSSFSFVLQYRILEVIKIWEE